MEDHNTVEQRLIADAQRYYDRADAAEKAIADLHVRLDKYEAGLSYAAAHLELDRNPSRHVQDALVFITAALRPKTLRQHADDGNA